MKRSPGGEEIQLVSLVSKGISEIWQFSEESLKLARSVIWPSQVTEAAPNEIPCLHINKSAHHLSYMSSEYLQVGEHCLLLELMSTVFTVWEDVVPQSFTYSLEEWGGLRLAKCILLLKTGWEHFKRKSSITCLMLFPGLYLFGGLWELSRPLG